jgi:tRNA 2-thiouridine synthesizing protein A
VTLPSDEDDDLLPAGELDARTVALQATVTDVASRPCATCGAVLCGHGAVLAVVLGYKHSPRCARCLAGELRETPTSLAERALQWIVRRDCFLHVWRRAGTAEGLGPVERPPCHFVAGAPPAETAPHGPAATATSSRPAAATYDAGDLGCGDLVLELRGQLRALPGGATLHVIAHDPAAPVDLPAWCGLVGHTLLAAEHPHYLIQRKRD